MVLLFKRKLIYFVLAFIVRHVYGMCILKLVIWGNTSKIFFSGDQSSEKNGKERGRKVHVNCGYTLINRNKNPNWIKYS